MIGFVVVAIISIGLIYDRYYVDPNLLQWHVGDVLDGYTFSSIIETDDGLKCKIVSGNGAFTEILTESAIQLDTIKIKPIKIYQALNLVTFSII